MIKLSHLRYAILSSMLVLSTAKATSFEGFYTEFLRTGCCGNPAFDPMKLNSVPTEKAQLNQLRSKKEYEKKF